MSRSRTRRSGKEYDQLDKLKHENSKLKREIGVLRRQLQRVDFDRYSNLHELVNKQRKESLAEENEAKRESLMKEWQCHSCGKDYLRINIWNHPVKGVMYFRKCNTCSHRTEMKPYTKDVKGIKAEEEK